MFPGLYRIIVYLTLAVAGMSSAPLVCGQETPGRRIEAKDAVEILRAARAEIRGGYSWKFTREMIGVANPDAQSIQELQIVPPKKTYHVSGQAHFDVQHGHYFVEMDSVVPWVDGAASHESRREGASFDGTTYRHWERSRHGTELPSLDTEKSGIVNQELGPLVGSISSTDARNPPWIEVNAGVMGLCFLPPYALLLIRSEQSELLMPIDEIIQSRINAGQTIPITEDNDGIWTIEFRDIVNDTLVAHYRVDPARGGICVGADFLEGSPPESFQRTLVSLENFNGVLWAPKEVVLLNRIDFGYTMRHMISDLELVPVVTAEDLRANFPAGTMVDDFIKGHSYSVGTGPVDEAASVKSYMQRHGLDELPQEAMDGKGNKLQFWFICCNVLIISALAGVAVWRRRRRPTKTG